MIGSFSTSFCHDPLARVAVERCAATLSVQLGSLVPDLLIAFVGGRHPPETVLHAMRDLFGSVPIVGGSAAGVIASAGFGYTGFEIGLIAAKGPAVTPTVLVERTLLDGERQAGRALGAATAKAAGDSAVVLLLFDSVAEAQPLRLHPASLLMEGFTEGLGDRSLHVIGGGHLADINISGSWIFDGVGVVQHAAVALVFPPGIAAVTAILHGCRPVSSFLEITRIEGSEVFELDGEPALSVIERRLQLDLGGAGAEALSLVATLGQKQGDPFAPYDEDNYVNRLILRADHDRGSITLFEPDFAAGTRVQIMSRDNALMLESVKRGVARIKQEIRGLDCLLGLYIDCAGRASVVTGAEQEEADLAIQSLQPDFPFMGFYSGVEIAPFAGHYSRPLDWTSVLTVLHRVP